MVRLLPLSALLLLFLCDVNPANANSYYDKVLAHSRIRGRDQGPNVCALQQILGTKKKYFSSCKNWYQGAICGKKTTVLYECCPGYMRMEGMKGCPAVMPIDHVYGTLGIVGATTTQHYSDVSKLREEIEGKGSYTYFAPSNEAWENLDSDIRRGLENNVNVELLNALHSHMVNKRMLTKDLKHGMVIPSMYNNLGLFINHYPNGVVTVNCARVIHGNQIATNGVVHVIDRVLTQIGTSIQDFIEAEDELSSFRAAAITSDLLESLGRDGHFTLFAPTNEAFEKLPRGVLERIMGDKVASEALMKYHILNTLQCSEAITGGAVFETMEGNTIEIGCEGDSISINGIKMVNKKDIVTKNGVIHLIDEVLIPDSAKQVIELAGKQQTTFTDLVAQLGLASSLKPDGEYTLLAPVNNAFSDDTLSMDQHLLKLILQNHILKVKVGLSDLYNGQILETIGGKQLRVFVYRTRFSIFLSLLEAADLKDLLTQPGDWTLFAPTNDAFKGMTNEEREILIGDKNALQNIILYHLTPGVYIGKGFEPGVTNILKTTQGSKIYLKGVNETLLVNELKSKESDIMTTNGVIHVVDKLLYPADIPVGNDQLLELLNKLIKYIQIKFVRGSTFKEIPMTVYTTKIITKLVEPKIKVIQGSLQPIIKTEGPAMTKIQIEGESDFRLIKEGETVTEVIHGEPVIKKYTKIIDGVPVEITEKQTREERIITEARKYSLCSIFCNQLFWGPEIKYTRISTGGGETEETLQKFFQKEVSKVTKFIEGGDGHLFEDEDIKRLLQGAPAEQPRNSSSRGSDIPFSGLYRTHLQRRYKPTKGFKDLGDDQEKAVLSENPKARQKSLYNPKSTI
ncbi:Periostin [Apodemus speciosus]|uniref:Periostin n=1 Tax=Apodemus speciosus TaxID=105296 RepID=A0ABQ0EL31_APOSI